MTNLKAQAMADVADQLVALKTAIRRLNELQTSDVQELTGHQTVDSRQSLLLSFERLESCVAEMEETLSSILEATINPASPDLR